MIKDFIGATDIHDVLTYNKRHYLLIWIFSYGLGNVSCFYKALNRVCHLNDHCKKGK